MRPNCGTTVRLGGKVPVSDPWLLHRLKGADREDGKVEFDESEDSADEAGEPL